MSGGPDTLGRRPIELHGLHGCKSTMCMVLMVWARSKDNVLKSQTVSEIVQYFFLSDFGDCPMLLNKAVMPQNPGVR